MGSAPAPGAAADALVRRRERASASRPPCFFHGHSHFQRAKRLDPTNEHPLADPPYGVRWQSRSERERHRFRLGTLHRA